MIIDELFEGPQLCPECGGISFSDLILAEKKDACYHKVKASAKVWPSAYASGRLVQCRKKGAANYGNKSEGVAEGMDSQVVFSGTGADGGTYEIIQSSPTDFMIHANGKHIDTYGSLQRAMSVLQNEVPGLQQGVAEGKADPTGSWVVYDGSKVKRFKSREGAKAYAAKNGGKVASSEFYADKIQKQGVAEGVMYGAENLNVGDDVIISGDVELNGATGVIDSFGQDKRFVVVDLYNHGRHSFHSSDVSANDYDSDEHDDDLAETRVGQVPMTLKPGETDNLEPEDFEGFKKLPAYKQGQQAQQSRGKDLIQQSPYTYQSDQDWAYRNGAFDARQAATSADFAKRGPLTTENTLDEKSVSQAQFRTMAGAAHNPEFARKVGISQDVAQEFNRADKKSNYKKLPARATEGEQQKGADYRDPKEVDYDAIDHDKSVARLKHLAGLGPMKTTYDPAKRQYRNMPTADQPKR
jgi:hypothetical protein